MRKHLKSEDISAFLDGEHDRPEAVQKHLQQCAECAREHMALQKLSTHVQALPECDVTHGFTDRVMRAVEQPQPAARRHQRSYWLPLGTGLAAVAAVVIAMVVLDGPRTQLQFGTTQVAVQQATAAPSFDFTGALGPDGSERDSLGGYPEVDGDMQIAYAEEVASRAVPHEFFTGADYSEGLVSLDSNEKETLLQLLGSTLIDEHTI